MSWYRSRLSRFGNGDVTGFETIDQIHEAFDTPPQPIQFPDDQCVAGTQVRECIVETGPSQASPAGFVLDDTIAAEAFLRASRALGH